MIGQLKRILSKKKNDNDGCDNFSFKDFDFYTPEDLEANEDEEFENKWHAMCHEIILNDDCPYKLLIKFVDSGGYYNIDYNVMPTRTRHVLLTHPNLINGLTNAGFGMLKNSNTGKIIGRLKNRRLVPNE